MKYHTQQNNVAENLGWCLLWKVDAGDKACLWELIIEAYFYSNTRKVLYVRWI